MDYLKLDSFVNDFSWVLNQENITTHNEKFFNYEQAYWVQIATVFIKNRNWRELKDIALEIFNWNWIWDKRTNSWLLLVVVTDEKKIRIMTWKWMEIEFPDSLAQEIIEWELRLLLNSWNYSQLLKSWYELATKSRSVNKINTSYSTYKTNNYGTSRNNLDININWFDLWIWFFIFITSIIFSFITWYLWAIFFGIALLWFVVITWNLIRSNNKDYTSYFLVLLFLSIVFLLWILVWDNNPWWNSNSSSYSSSNYDSDRSSNYDSDSSYDSDWGGWSSNWWGYWD